MIKTRSQIFLAFGLKTFVRRLAGGGYHVVESIVMVKGGDVNNENKADFDQALAVACAQKDVQKRRKPVILGPSEGAA